MSENEQAKSENPLSSIIASVTKLHSENPKVLYGGAAAVFILILLVAMSPGGEDADMPKLDMGSTYTIRNINGGNVLLTTVPTFSSADDVGEDNVNACLINGSARGKLVEQRTVNHIPYVRMEVADGNCQGKTGWTTSVNIAT